MPQMEVVVWSDKYLMNPIFVSVKVKVVFDVEPIVDIWLQSDAKLRSNIKRFQNMLTGVSGRIVGGNLFHTNKRYFQDLCIKVCWNLFLVWIMLISIL